MKKSTITIIEDEKQITFEVHNDPPATGPRDTWHIPARTADGLVKWLIGQGRDRGIEPVLEIQKNSVTGHVDIITRQKEDEE